MDLKTYQTETLAVLRRFLEEARLVGPANAFQKVTGEPEQAARLGSYLRPYRQLRELPDVPHVCLRLPTGGGKTILGAHAVAVARDAYMERDFPLVLWLVPSRAIQGQTIEALQNQTHPYRKVLDEAFAGRVQVFDIVRFPEIRPQDIRSTCCVIVGTIQSLRIKHTEGRKSYAHHEALEPHFTGFSGPWDGLETSAAGQVKFSFVNLLHLHRPLMVVDEAHNAVTGLTREMQARVNPSAIIEFTATPSRGGKLVSNILHTVTAGELKREDMIKLPIILSEHRDWQSAVNAAIVRRASLAETAKGDPGGLRPIVLFQAQPRNQPMTAGALRAHLIENEKISKERIAVATGRQRELDGVDLLDSGCKVEFVITVEALKEGWDCPFAYVFCSLQRIHSAKDAEQLLGRVLRMPYATRRARPELNRAYAFLSEPEFGEAARGLVDRLVAMGFEEEEAEAHVERAQLPFGDSVTTPVSPSPNAPFVHVVALGADLQATLENLPREGWKTRSRDDGKTEIISVTPLHHEAEAAIAAVLPKLVRAAFFAAVEAHRRQVTGRRSPSELGEQFVAPGLAVRLQGKLEFAATDRFMDVLGWSLLDFPAQLAPGSLDAALLSRESEVDIDDGRVTWSSWTESLPSMLSLATPGWTPESLVIWLDHKIRQPDVRQIERLKWLSDLVAHEMGDRGRSLSELVRIKFLLARRIRDQISSARRKARETAHRRYLFAPAANPEVSFDRAFAFTDGMYAGERKYRGRWRPLKHYLAAVPAFDGAEDGEEIRCAQVLDELPQIHYWLRNVSRHPQSFWLPLASGRFYPDFVARLTDGRILVVEYKGSHLVSDSRDKRVVGELWERRSDGRCLFIMAERDRDGKDVRAQLVDKIKTVETEATG